MVHFLCPAVLLWISRSGNNYYQSRSVLEVASSATSGCASFAQFTLMAKNWQIGKRQEKEDVKDYAQEQERQQKLLVGEPLRTRHIWTFAENRIISNALRARNQDVS